MQLDNLFSFKAVFIVLKTIKYCFRIKSNRIRYEMKTYFSPWNRK